MAMSEIAKHDRVSSLFFIGVALAICVESLRVGPGSLAAPGPGFIPLVSGVLLGLLGFFVFLGTLRNNRQGRKGLWERGTQWRKMVAALAALVGYTFSVETLGFNLSNFLFMGVILLSIGKFGYKTALFAAVIAASVCWVLFDHLLGIRVTSGVFGFYR